MNLRRLAVVVLTCDRPDHLRRTLLGLHASEVPPGWQRDVTLVDNSEGTTGRGAADGTLGAGLVDVLVRSRCNAGIASGWNLGYGAACAPDPYGGRGAPDVVALVQDDVDLEPDWFVACLLALEAWPDLALVSGYNSPHHETTSVREDHGVKLYVQPHLPGVHLVARREFWQGVFPLQTSHHHLNEDWEITRDSSGAPCNIGKVCGVIPGLAIHRGAESTWRRPTDPQPIEYRDPVREILQDGTRPTAALLDALRGAPGCPLGGVEVAGGVPAGGGPLMVLHERAEGPEGRGLTRWFGFRNVLVAEAAEALGAGRPVLLRGWRPEYRPLVDAYGSLCICTWNSDWAGAELMREDAPLAELLMLVRARRVGLLWWSGAEAAVTLPGAWSWRPVWHLEMQEPLPLTARRPQAIALGPHTNPYSHPAKNTLAAAAALAHAGYEIHMAAASFDGPMGRALTEVLHGEHVMHYGRLPQDALVRLLRSVHLVVHPSLADTWPTLAVAAVYAGTPVLLSDAIAWADRLSWEVRAACVVQPATSTARIRALVGWLVGNTALWPVVLDGQRRALEEALATHVAFDRGVLRQCGFAVPDDAR